MVSFLGTEEICPSSGCDALTLVYLLIICVPTINLRCGWIRSPDMTYLGSHEHEVVENHSCGLQGAPASAPQLVGRACAVHPTRSFIIRVARGEDWEEQAAIHQLNVTEPG